MTCCPIPDTRRRYDSVRAPISAGFPRAWTRRRGREQAAAAARPRRGTRGRARGGQAGADGERVWYSSGTGDDFDFEDLLGGLFSRRGRRGWGGPVPGADQEAEVELTVEEAHRGGRRSVTISTARTDRGPLPSTFRPGSPRASGYGWPVRVARAATAPRPVTFTWWCGSPRTPGTGSTGVTSTSICRSPRGRRRSA